MPVWNVTGRGYVTTTAVWAPNTFVSFDVRKAFCVARMYHLSIGTARPFTKPLKGRLIITLKSTDSSR